MMWRRTVPMIASLILVSMSLPSLSLAAQDAPACPDTILPSLYTGGQGMVMIGDSANNLRANPDVAAELVTQMPPGARFDVVDGPTCGGGYNWWQVDYNGVVGWTVGGDATDFYLQAIFPNRFQGYSAVDDHIAFDYDTGLGDNATSVYTPAAVLDPSTPDSGQPEHVQVSLSRYDTEIGMTIPTGVEVTVFTNRTAAEGSAYAAAQSALAAAIASGSAPIQSLANPNMPQVFTARPQALTFSGGQGVRYLGLYAFDTALVSSANLRYYFEGVTDDGQYTVQVAVPVSTAELSANGDGTASTDYPGYIAGVASSLDALAEADFTPSLDTLDALIGSITITPPTVTLPVQADADGLAVIRYGGVSFRLDPVLASRIEVTETAENGELMGMYGAEPGFTAIQLLGYPVVDAPAANGYSTRLQSPELFIYRPTNFERRFAPDESAFLPRLAQIRDFLQQQPALDSFNGDAAQVQSAIPILPLYNAAQVFVSQPQYVIFEGGRGVRFLTAYSQAPLILTERVLFYSFTGISDDGKTAFAATFPLVSGVLAQDEPVIEDYDAYFTQYEQLLADAVMALDARDPAAFTPSLSQLDALVASLRME